VKIRLMRTTHYQTGHPVFLSFLISMCTSPSESKSQRKVAYAIHEVLKSHGYNFSREATKFLIRMAQEMELLQPNHLWTWKAFVIDFFKEKDNLSNYHGETRIRSLANKIIYLKYYLESDGGFLLHFARRVLSENGLKKHTLRFVNGALESIFEEAINEYLSVITDFKEKVRLRRFLELVKRKGYEPKVRIHKAFPHLDPLVDLDILDYDVKSHVYLSRISNGKNVTEVFLKQFPNIACLENIFSEEKPAKPGYFKKASEVFDISCQDFTKENLDAVIQNILQTYSKIKDEITGLASIKSIKDIVCALQLSEYRTLCEWSDVDFALQELKREKGANMRFHVNRKGEVEYVVMS
jgi:hypothetical protein